MASTGAGKTAGAVLAGFLCLGLFLFAIAATIILSLISIYTPNSSQAGFGDGEYHGVQVLFTPVRMLVISRIPTQLIGAQSHLYKQHQLRVQKWHRC